MPSKYQAATAAAAAALTAAIAIPTVTGAQTGGRDVTVREKVRAAQFVHAKDSTKGERLARGDRVITSQAMFDGDNRPLGTLYTDCVNAGRAARVFNATLQCTSTYRFSDGQVVSAGVVKLGSGPRGGFPIVGGSDAYKSARGQITPGAPAKGYDGVDVLHLDG
ncbi:MAG TPA: hypothetical protein VF752_17380 [Thermoleophilaceae bacterium]